MTVSAGDLAEPVGFAVLATDQLDAVRGLASPPAPTSAGGRKTVCFEASSGGVDVVFVPWTMAISSGAGALEPPWFYGENCTAVSRDTPGVVEVTGTAPGGLTATVRVEFVTPTSARQLTSATPEAAGPSLGERAGG